MDKIATEVSEIVKEPEIIKQFAAAGIEPAGSDSPEEFAAFIRSQADVRAKVIQAVGIKID